MKNEDWINLVEKNKDKIVKEVEQLILSTGYCPPSKSNFELYLCDDGRMFAITNNNKSALPQVAYDGQAIKIYQVDNDLLSCEGCDEKDCEWREFAKRSNKELIRDYVPSAEAILDEINSSIYEIYTTEEEYY